MNRHPVKLDSDVKWTKVHTRPLHGNALTTISARANSWSEDFRDFTCIDIDIDWKEFRYGPLFNPLIEAYKLKINDGNDKEAKQCYKLNIENIIYIFVNR